MSLQLSFNARLQMSPSFFHNHSSITGLYISLNAKCLDVFTFLSTPEVRYLYMSFSARVKIILSIFQRQSSKYIHMFFSARVLIFLNLFQRQSSDVLKIISTPELRCL